MVKVGDILEFEKPIHSWHKKDLENGAKYIVEQDHKKKIVEKADGWWHVIKLPELDEMRVVLRGKNFCYLLDYLKNYSNYKVIGNVNH